MPFLKFKCGACETVFDELVPASRIDAVRCARCGGLVSRAYEGACLFGNPASSAGRGGCSGDCGGCSGCDSKSHGSGCSCGGCH